MRLFRRSEASCGTCGTATHEDELQIEVQRGQDHHRELTAAGDGAGSLCRPCSGLLVSCPSLDMGFQRMGTPVRYVMPANWSSRPSRIVDDASGPSFEVRPASNRGTWSLRAADGHELAVINGLPRPGATAWLRSRIFEVVVGGQQAATVCHRGFLNSRYEVSTPTGQLTAIYERPDYTLMSSGVSRATILRLGLIRQEIAMEFADGEDPVILIAVVLAIEVIHESINPHLGPTDFIPMPFS